METRQYDYDPYGRLIRETGPKTASCPFRYSTKYRNPELDLYYYGHRWYDAAAMKWLTPDPIGERGGANLTAFCSADPINQVDPLGLFTLEGMYEQFLAKYGDRGLRLLRFLAAEGWTIEGRDFWWPRVSFDENARVLALELDWSDQKAADKLFKALSARYDKVLGRFLRGAGAIVGASIVEAEALGLEGYEAAWTETAAELSRIGSQAQEAVESEAKWVLLTVAGFKSADWAIDALRMRRLSHIVRTVEPAQQPILFGQKSIGRRFRHGTFAGKSIEEVAAGLRAGSIKPEQLPIMVIRREKATYALNNRSLMALRQAGIEPTFIIDVTGDPWFERELNKRLSEIGHQIGANFVPPIRGVP